VSALDAYDYVLPPERIAQAPLAQRDASRLMVLQRGQPGWRHERFSRLPEILAERLPRGTVLVFNNTRVIPAKLVGRRLAHVEGSGAATGTASTGGALEALLVEELGPGRWRAMVKPARRLKAGQAVTFGDGVLTARCVERTAEGQWVLDFDDPSTFRERLERAGRTPLPPYIRRDVGANTPGVGDPGAYVPGSDDPRDREAYQTVYASRPGAVAAPTAGLHFTRELLGRLDAAGFERVELTLHVGPGTFAPVKVDDPAQHRMHAEAYEIPEPAAQRLLAARAEGRPIVAVGTTAVRSLEAWARQGFPLGYAGVTELFIYPPFDFRVAHGILTNFHLPRSTLLMLVAAFYGRDRMLAAYEAAVEAEYRFFSFGDAMLMLP
jgi:S-adenosylmethionine:tRNA ribosyltransferase-isomerase